MVVARPFRDFVLRLTPEERRALILAYQSYHVELGGLPQESFGADFDTRLDAALREGDRRGVLRAGARDVMETLSDVARFRQVEWERMRDSLQAALPPGLCLRVLAALDRAG